MRTMRILLRERIGGQDKTFETTIVFRAEVAAYPEIKDKLEHKAEAIAKHGLDTYFKTVDTVLRKMEYKEGEEKRKLGLFSRIHSP